MRVRFEFGESTVLVASCGLQVSFYTTVGGGVAGRWQNKGAIQRLCLFKGVY